MVHRCKKKKKTEHTRGLWEKTPVDTYNTLNLPEFGGNNSRCIHVKTEHT